MVNPTTTNVLLQVPLHGAEVDTWDVPVNSDFTSLDGFLGGVQTINAAGLSPITLTAPAGAVTPAGGPSQSQNAALKFTGVLTGNVPVTLPLPGQMVVHNLTTGPFVLSFRAIGSGEVIAIDQGAVQRIYNDGTNVYFVDLPQVGSYLDTCDSTFPAWIAACTKPPYLLCNGGTFNAVTYPYLNAKLGGNTLPDARGRVRAMLNLGSARLQAANGVNGDVNYSAGGTDSQTLVPSQIPSIVSSNGAQSITVTTNVPVIHDSPGNQALGPGTAGVGFPASPFNSPVTATGINTISVNSINTSGLSHPNVQPTYIGGLTLIRAG